MVINYLGKIYGSIRSEFVLDLFFLGVGVIIFLLWFMVIVLGYLDLGVCFWGMFFSCLLLN